MDNTTTFKLVKFTIEIQVVMPVIKGKTDLRQEVTDMIDNIHNDYGWDSWDYVGHIEEIN